ncbi:MAG: hypothetical protein ACQEXJ_18530 [Myxococcota bacterium]
MSAADFLRRLTEAFDAAGAPYMLVGSFASTYHGAPRTTQDVDVVVELDRASLARLLGALPEERYYVSREAAVDAVRRRQQFNVVDLETGWKADLIVRKGRRFSREEFGRRVHAEVLGVPVWIASAEDVVLSKLEWASMGGGSERQLRDVAGVIRIRGDALDILYIERWAHELGVDELWRSAREAAG